MAYSFYIKQNATLPTLRMEVFNTGHNDFHKICDALQAADVTFTMVNVETGVKRVAKAKANVIKKPNADCTEEYYIEYPWKPRDTKEKGTFKGEFSIQMYGGTIRDGETIPEGILIVPISEELLINII